MKAIKAAEEAQLSALRHAVKPSLFSLLLFLSSNILLTQTPTVNPPQKTATIILDNNSNRKTDPNGSETIDVESGLSFGLIIFYLPMYLN
jgi:hypothetical protein